jgi:hypothetical protein
MSDQKSILAVCDALTIENAELKKRLDHLEYVVHTLALKVGINKDIEVWERLIKFDPNQTTLMPRKQQKIV